MPATRWSSHLLQQYGLSTVEYRTMLEKQGQRCAICGKQAPEGKKLSVDHSHASGKVRELLCLHCNTLLGHCFERVEILEKAIEYLRRHYEDAYDVDRLKKILIGGHSLLDGEDNTSGQQSK